MIRRCPACGAEILEAQAECPLCAEGTWREPPAAPGGAPELSQWGSLGWKPGEAMESVRALPPEEELPAEEMPPEPSPARDFRMTVLRAGAVALLVATVALFAARVTGVLQGASVEDAPPADWPGLGFPDRLAALRDVVPDAFPPWEPDLRAGMAALESRSPDAVRAAREAHEPLPEDVDVAHDVFRVVLDRLAARRAEWAVWLGVHPHPRELRPSDDEERAAFGLLARDVYDWCVVHPDSETRKRHEIVDRRLLRSWAADRLAGLDRDAGDVDVLADIVSGLWRLHVVDCCPQEERQAALAALLDGVPEYVDAALAGIASPLADDCDRVAELLRYDAQRLRSELGPAEAGETPLATAARRAAEALDAAAARLGTWPGRRVLPDEPDRDLRSASYFAWLAWELGHRTSPRGLFDRCVGEMRDANRDLVRLWEGGDPSPPDRNPIWTPARRVARLQGSVLRWVDEAPDDDPGVVFRAVRDESVEWSGLLYAAAPRSRGVASVYLASWPDGTLAGQDRVGEKRRRQHLAAHETYPGHHLQHLFAARTCDLRSALSSEITAEGWATYAEDLIHETGSCADDVMDRWVRGQARFDRALRAAVEILYACGRHSVVDLAGVLGGPDDGASTGWLRFAVRPGASVPYVLGRLEIQRIRKRAEAGAGRDPDPRRFFRRLLQQGPLPPPLLERALFGE